MIFSLSLSAAPDFLGSLKELVLLVDVLLQSLQILSQVFFLSNHFCRPRARTTRTVVIFDGRNDILMLALSPSFCVNSTSSNRLSRSNPTNGWPHKLLSRRTLRFFNVVPMLWVAVFSIRVGIRSQAMSTI